MDKVDFTPLPFVIFRINQLFKVNSLYYLFNFTCCKRPVLNFPKKGTVTNSGLFADVGFFNPVTL